MTIIDTFAGSLFSSKPKAATENNLTDLTESPLFNEISGLIKQDPFMTISELKTLINKSSVTASISWWRLFRILKKKKLSSRKARFRFARNAYRA